jgi:hypothetical protein
MKKLIISIIFTTILLVPLISAEINLNINVPSSFSLDEKIFFNYSLISESNIQVTFIPHINCPSAPVAFTQERTIELKSNQIYTGTYSDFQIKDWMESQTCTAYVQILSPIQQTVSKEFEINTNPSFEFDLILDKKIFTQNEEITLDYSSSIESLFIDTTLTYPDGSINKIELPFSFTPEQIGTYELEVTASKEGYKTVTETEQFGVIESDVQIGYTAPNNGYQSNGEEVEEINYWLYVLIGIPLIIFIILIGIAYKLFISRRIK